jgi:hypothetical protein
LLVTIEQNQVHGGGHRRIEAEFCQAIKGGRTLRAINPMEPTDEGRFGAMTEAVGGIFGGHKRGRETR